jgi:hypothetical protein
MAYRRFVLNPAVEIAAELVHPPTRYTVAELLARLDDAPPWIAILGGPGQLRAAIARRAAELAGCTYVPEPVEGELDEAIRRFGLDTTPPAGAAGPDRRPPGVEAQPAAAGHLWRWEWPIECLRHRVAALAGLWTIPTPAGTGNHMVTDFHWVELRALANCFAASAGADQFEREWQSLTGGHAHPKLAVQLRVRGPAAAAEPSGPLLAWQRELERLIRLPRQAPVLCLDVDQPDEAAAEIAAAVLAMQ